MPLQKAVKQQAKLRMAIIGPAGSGKTFSALRIAKTLAGDKRIALFDTEHGSAVKYSKHFDFDTDNIVAPFHPDKFGAAIREAVAGNYGVVILDSLSHAWNGEGGILDIVEQFAKRMKNPNSFAAWKDATPIQNRLTETILAAGIHVIVTMRSKVEYVLGDNGRGQQVPRKVGMAPIQRENWDYEFDVVMEMDTENNGIITKTRCSDLAGGVFAKPGENIAVTLKDWLSDGQPEVEQPKTQTNPAPPVEPEVQFMDDGQSPAEDNPFDNQPATNGNGNGHSKPVISKTSLATLHALGVAYYGKEWDKERKRLVDLVTKGAESSSAKLTVNEGATLISGLEKKIRAECAELVQLLQGSGDNDPLPNFSGLVGVKLADAHNELKRRVEAVTAEPTMVMA